MLTRISVDSLYSSCNDLTVADQTKRIPAIIKSNIAARKNVQPIENTLCGIWLVRIFTETATNIPLKKVSTLSGNKKIPQNNFLI